MNNSNKDLSITADLVHFFIITVYRKYPNEEPVEFLHWKNLRFDLRVKYDWYFKYRAALLQVKYPKYLVETSWGHEIPEEKYLAQLRKNKIRARKAKITEIRNKIAQAEKEWNGLFPIKDDPIYIKACIKLKRLIEDLEIFINQNQNL